MNLFGAFGRKPGDPGTGGRSTQAAGHAADAVFAGGAGWFGKLPTLGDFASRRLPPEFITAWDAWLSAGLAFWQRADADWPAGYMQAPSLRFVLGPGVLAPSVVNSLSQGLPGHTAAGGSTLAGVVMPSVDRVGREFPLSIVRAVGVWPLSIPAFTTVVDWLDAADALALQAVQDDWTADQLDQHLAALDSTLAGGDPGLGSDPHAPVLAWQAAITHGLRSSLWCPAGNAAPTGCGGLPVTDELLHLFGAARTRFSD